MEWLEADGSLWVLLPDKHPKKIIRMDAILATVRKKDDVWEYEITATKEIGTRNSRIGAISVVNAKVFKLTG
jgi:hypothetical protein